SRDDAGSYRHPQPEHLNDDPPAPRRPARPLRLQRRRSHRHRDHGSRAQPRPAPRRSLDRQAVPLRPLRSRGFGEGVRRDAAACVLHQDRLAARPHLYRQARAEGSRARGARGRPVEAAAVLRLGRRNADRRPGPLCRQRRPASARLAREARRHAGARGPRRPCRRLLPLPARPRPARSGRLGGAGHFLAFDVNCCPGERIAGLARPAAAGPYSPVIASAGAVRAFPRLQACNEGPPGAMNRVITARTDPETARSYWTMSRADSDRAFRAARRHSRIVRILRVALPIAVVGALALTVLVTYLNPLRMISSLPVNIDKLVVSGTKITMEKPRLAGFTHDARAYEMSAESAQQDLTKPDLVELYNLHAKLQMQDKTTMTMSAAKGHYDAKTEILKLEKDILLSDKSYEGRLSEATIDISKGNVVSNAPVELRMLQGTLNANHLEVIDSGDLVRFTQGVTLDLTNLNQSSSPKGSRQDQGSAAK